MNNLIVMPQAVEVERQVIGAMLVDQDAIASVSGLLSETDFYDVRNGLLFRAITSLAEKNQTVDALTVSESLRASGEYSRAGGEPFLMEIMGSVVTSVGVEDHARIVRDKSLKRKQMKLASWLHGAAASGMAGKDIQDELERMAFALHDQNRAGAVLRPIRDVLADSFRGIAQVQSGELTGLPTGLRALDRHMGGLQRGDLIVIGGRPGQGKTSLSAQIGINIAKIGVGVAFFECEMKDRAVVDRALFAEAGISQQDFRHGKVPESKFPKLAQASETLKNIPFFINDGAGITPMQIRTQCRKMKREKGLGVIFIDNIQRMKSDSRTTDPRIRAGEVSCALKEIAKEFDVPVVAISHLRRLQNGEGTEPTLADLQESGNIEQDADIVIALYNESLYREVPEQAQGKVKVLFLKYREGSLGYKELYFKNDLVTFTDWEDRPQPSYANFMQGDVYGP